MSRVAHHKFPLEEQEASLFLEISLNNMQRFIRYFASDLKLLDHCLLEKSKLIGPEDRPKREIFALWSMVSARDGAMNVYHFGKSLHGAGHALAKCHSSKGKRDEKMLKNARRLFATSFPRNEAVRHAVGHSAELAYPDWHKNHSFTGSHSGKGFSVAQATNVMINPMLLGRTFTATFEGKILSYELSEKALEVLERVQTLYHDALGELLER